MCSLQSKHQPSDLILIYMVPFYLIYFTEDIQAQKP